MLVRPAGADDAEDIARLLTALGYPQGADVGVLAQRFGLAAALAVGAAANVVTSADPCVRIGHPRGVLPLASCRTQLLPSGSRKSANEP